MPFLWKTAPKKSTSVLQLCQGSVPAACLCRVGFTSPSFSAFNKLEIPLRSCCCSSQQAGKAAEARAASLPHPSLSLQRVPAFLMPAQMLHRLRQLSQPQAFLAVCIYSKCRNVCMSKNCMNIFRRSGSPKEGL